MFTQFQTNANSNPNTSTDPSKFGTVDKKKLLQRRLQMKKLAETQIDIKDAEREMTEAEKKAMHDNNNDKFENAEVDDLFFGDDQEIFE